MEEQRSSIFRKRSIERISSPEQLNDYLKVSNPGIWVLLITVILLFTGFFAWGSVGRLETLTEGVAVVKDGQATIMLKDTANSDIDSGMKVRIGSDEYLISAVEHDDYGRAVAHSEIDKTDGKYDVKIVTESIHPISFLFD